LRHRRIHAVKPGQPGRGSEVLSMGREEEVMSITYELDCGCEVFLESLGDFLDVTQADPRIDYCPMHAAAPLMYEALRDVKIWLSELGWTEDVMYGEILFTDNDPGDIADSVDAALAAAGDNGNVS